MKSSHDLDSLFPAILGCQPSRASWQKEHAEKQDNCWEDLNSPWNSESGSRLASIVGSTINIRGTILDEILNQNSPCNRPLLQWHNSTPNFLWCNFCLVYRTNSGGNPNTNTSNDSSNYQHADVDGSALETNKLSWTMLTKSHWALLTLSPKSKRDMRLGYLCVETICRQWMRKIGLPREIQRASHMWYHLDGKKLGHRNIACMPGYLGHQTYCWYQNRKDRRLGKLTAF